MTVTRDITNAIAVLAASSAAGLTWRTDGTAYATNETGIYRKRMPDGLRGLAITVVARADNPSQPLGSVMIQLKARGAKNNPSDPDDILDACFDKIHGTTGVASGGCILIQVNRGVSVPSTVDEAGVWERIDQYYSDVNYPATTLRPLGGSW